MNNLSLKIRAIPSNSFVFLDEKLIKMKKNQFSNRTYALHTEKKQVSLKIFKVQELTLKNWWVYEILYFVLSVFGLFDFRRKSSFYELSFDANLELIENSNVELVFETKSENAVTIKNSNIELDIKENTKKVDELAKKRHKAVVWLKVGIWLLMIAAVLLIVYFIRKW